VLYDEYAMEQRQQAADVGARGFEFAARSASYRGFFSAKS
jgi:hypothetical protein